MLAIKEVIDKIKLTFIKLFNLSVEKSLRASANAGVNLFLKKAMREPLLSLPFARLFSINVFVCRAGQAGGYDRPEAPY